MSPCLALPNASPGTSKTAVHATAVALSWQRCVQGAELQTGPGSSRPRRQGGSDSGTDTDAEPGTGRARPRRCHSREALAEAAAASREHLAAARGGKGDGRDAAGGEVPLTPGLKQRVKSGALRRPNLGLCMSSIRHRGQRAGSTCSSRLLCMPRRQPPPSVTLKVS